MRQMEYISLTYGEISLGTYISKINIYWNVPIQISLYAKYKQKVIVLYLSSVVVFTLNRSLALSDLQIATDNDKLFDAKVI